MYFSVTCTFDLLLNDYLLTYLLTYLLIHLHRPSPSYTFWWTVSIMGSSVVNRTANKAGAQLLAPFRLWMEELSGDCLSSVAQSRRRTINRAPQSIHHPPVASDDKLKTVANFCLSSPARQFVASSTAQ